MVTVKVEAAALEEPRGRARPHTRHTRRWQPSWPARRSAIGHGWRASMVAAMAIVVMAGSAAAADTIRASVGSGGQADKASRLPSISANGRYVAFESDATNLVPNDTNGVADIFVRDTVAGTTTRVSVRSNGAQGNERSFQPAISGNGRYVAFASIGNNLITNDHNGRADVFVHDRQTGTTTIVSVRSNRAQVDGDSFRPSISFDGRFVAFTSDGAELVKIPPNDPPNYRGVFLRDRKLGKTIRVSQRSDGRNANGESGGPYISANGRFVAFTSWATNLVKGDRNGDADVFVHDRVTRRTTRVSVNSAERQANGGSNAGGISGTGRFVAFGSSATNLVRGDTNGHDDAFLRDRRLGTTIALSVGIGGKPNGHTGPRGVSNSGRDIVMVSSASNLVANDTNDVVDVFVRDRVSRTTTRASVGNGQADGPSEDPAISGDGTVVVFASEATNLVGNDTNDQPDVFVRGPM